jgi:uncharacterized membrane protein
MLACPPVRAHRVAVRIAILFGALTLLAGGSILLGLREAGYHVVQPVLLFNTVMGLVYIGAAVATIRDLDLGWRLAFAIGLVNAVVLVAVSLYGAAGGTVAAETVVAMIARTAVWFGIFGLLSWRRAPRPPRTLAA